MPNTIYYARIDADHPVERPAGIVRRIEMEGTLIDQAFTRNMEWQPTEYFQLHSLGHHDDEYVEITEEAADQIIAAWQRRLAAGER
jgi:hypothetical protein